MVAVEAVDHAACGASHARLGEEARDDLPAIDAEAFVLGEVGGGLVLA